MNFNPTRPPALYPAGYVCIHTLAYAVLSTFLVQNDSEAPFGRFSVMLVQKVSCHLAGGNQCRTLLSLYCLPPWYHPPRELAMTHIRLRSHPIRLIASSNTMNFLFEDPKRNNMCRTTPCLHSAINTTQAKVMLGESVP